MTNLKNNQEISENELNEVTGGALDNNDQAAVLGGGAGAAVLGGGAGAAVLGGGAGAAVLGGGAGSPASPIGGLKNK